MIHYDPTGEDKLGKTTGTDMRRLAGLPAGPIVIPGAANLKVKPQASLQRRATAAPQFSPTTTALEAKKKTGGKAELDALSAQAKALFDEVVVLTGMTQDEYKALESEVGITSLGGGFGGSFFTKQNMLDLIAKLQGIKTAAQAAPQGKTKALVEEAKAVATKLEAAGALPQDKFVSDYFLKYRATGPWTFAKATALLAAIKADEAKLLAALPPKTTTQLPPAPPPPPVNIPAGGGGGEGTFGPLVTEEKPPETPKAPPPKAAPPEQKGSAVPLLAMLGAAAWAYFKKD